MNIVFIIVFFALLVFVSIWLIKNKLFYNDIVKHFKKCNCVVDGKKGSGKDLLFQKVINTRNETYYSNIDYGKRYIHVDVKDISASGNTYKDFIVDNVKKSQRLFYETKDIYISDGGIYLPSYMDATLYKTYPSFPIFYALSRHLYRANVHVNIQNFARLWKALREQADFFIHVHKTINFFGFLIIKATTYDKYESAVAYLSPVKSRIMNKYSKSEVDIYRATNGEIKRGYIIIRKRSIKYNSRAFENVLLDGERLTIKR